MNKISVSEGTLNSYKTNSIIYANGSMGCINQQTSKANPLV